MVKSAAPVKLFASTAPVVSVFRENPLKSGNQTIPMTIVFTVWWAQMWHLPTASSVFLFLCCRVGAHFPNRRYTFIPTLNCRFGKKNETLCSLKLTEEVIRSHSQRPHSTRFPQIYCLTHSIRWSLPETTSSKIYEKWIYYICIHYNY